MSAESIHEFDAARRIAALEAEVAALRSSEERYRGIIENMELGILEVDAEDRIVRAHSSFCQIVGYDEAELLGRKASEVFLVEEDRVVMDATTRARNQGESGLYELPILHRNGEVKWLLISGVPIYGAQGEVIGSMGIHYDITQRKRDEAELHRAKEAADEARQVERDFLAKMSHEIRTPMNAILGMSQLMESANLGPHERKLLQGIQGGSRLLKGLLDDALDLVKLDAGKRRCEARPTPLRGVVEDVLLSFDALLESKGLTLDVVWNVDADILLNLDGTMVSQVLLNAVGNALKFTEQGGLTITVDWTEGSDKGASVLELVIEDTGMGIPEDELPRVFERFGQASNRTVKQGGTGLGLAIVQELCEAHGGSASVASVLGSGSTFTFQFEADLSHAIAEEPSASIEHQWRGKRVLVVEDNEVNLFFIRTLLEKWGMVVTSAVNGEEALQCAYTQDFDLIFMDIQMPECDGLEATRRLRAWESEKGRPAMSIVALSAFAFDHHRESALRVGMNAYLTKPFDLEDLMAVCHRFLSQ